MLASAIANPGGLLELLLEIELSDASWVIYSISGQINPHLIVKSTPSCIYFQMSKNDTQFHFPSTWWMHSQRTMVCSWPQVSPNPGFKAEARQISTPSPRSYTKGQRWGYEYAPCTARFSAIEALATRRSDCIAAKSRQFKSFLFQGQIALSNILNFETLGMGYWIAIACPGKIIYRRNSSEEFVDEVFYTGVGKLGLKGIAGADDAKSIW